MRFIIVISVLLSFNLFADEVAPSHTEAIQLMSKNGVTIESLIEAEKTRSNNLKMQYPNISEEAISSINALFNPEVMFSEYVDIAEKTIGKDGLHALNTTHGTPEYHKAEKRYKTEVLRFQDEGRKYINSIGIKFADIIRDKVDPSAFPEIPSGHNK